MSGCFTDRFWKIVHYLLYSVRENLRETTTYVLVHVKRFKMSSASCKVLLWILAVMLMFSPQSAEGVKKTTCGQRSAHFNARARIVDGKISQAGMWPWQIALYKVPNFHCCGALISRRWVLTAAHCFYKGRNFISKANLFDGEVDDA
ncbi:hypothetical protein ACROYT_G003818 [Oculina patagonica]